MSARLTTEQRVRVTVLPLTAAGNPAQIDGNVLFSSGDEVIASVESIDATSAYVTARGLGATQILASFDADLGEGVRTLVFTGAVEVVGAEAESAEIVFGNPELIPPQE